MLETYTHALIQLDYIKATATNLPDYRPDGKTPEQIGALRTAGGLIKEDYRDKKIDLDLARGAVLAAHGPAHEACVVIYPCMKSCYRDDAKNRHTIVRLPKSDRTPIETLERTKSISTLWGKLPNVPGMNGPLKVGTLDKAVFDTRLAALDTAISDETNFEQEFQGAEGALHGSEAELTRFIAAALTQGRAQFPPNTPGHSMIDNIPTEPATQAPGQAVFTLAEAQSQRAVRLAFTAPHATRFQIWHKGPGEEQFTQAGESLVPGEYYAGVIPGGLHEYKVVPENSRGEGPASEMVSFNIPAENVA